MNKKIIFVPLFLSFLSIAIVYGEEAKTGERTESETAFVVRGVSKVKAATLKRSVPLFETWEELGSIENWLDTKIKSSQRFDEISEISLSSQVYSPLLSPISFPSRVLDLPVVKIPAKEWEVSILNFRGKVIDSMRGKGTPPTSVVWSGFPKRGEMLRVGFPYSYLLEIKDGKGKIYRYGGKSFNYSSLAKREANSFTITYCLRDLFKKGSADISPEGKRLLKRGVQMFREHLGKKRSFTLEIYERENEGAQFHRSIIQKALQEMLILSPGDIQVKIYLLAQAEPLPGWIRISVPMER